MNDYSDGLDGDPKDYVIVDSNGEGRVEDTMIMYVGKGRFAMVCFEELSDFVEFTTWLREGGARVVNDISEIDLPDDDTEPPTPPLEFIDRDYR